MANVAEPRINSGLSRTALLALALLFFGALSWLFALRLENGDFLPAYSSLRKDPMGTAVLYESLLRSGIQVQRNHDPLSRAVLNSRETLLIIGHHGTFSEIFHTETEQETLTSFVEQGGRLIITSTQTSFSGAGDEEERESDETDCEPDDQEQAVEKDKKEAEEKSAEQAETSEENKEAVDDEPVPPPWAVQTKSFDKEKKKKDNKGSTATGILGGTKIRLIWPNNVVFKELDEHWQILLRLNDEPVLIQRKLGQGNIVLATSSFFLSNEAMLRDRQVALLAWLTGNPSRLTFDEFHHGLRSQESIAGMIRSHNLHGVIIILLLLAFLFVWKNSSSLLPRSGSQEKTTHQRIGRDQFEGMVNTLRLHPPENLVVTALQQWAKSNRKWCQAHPEQLRKMHQAALEDPQQAEKTKNTSRETQQVACYQAISRILHENKNKPPHHQQENL